jgi:trans-2,3-dihydro-3-hydroxyanthranilate isomerase
MKIFPFMQVDAFTDHALRGNPCAILFETDDLDDATMLAISREMNLSETAFVRHSTVADFGVRYFTPAEEIPLAGHPTIATTFALVDSGRLKLAGAYTQMTLELRVGPIPVEIYADQGRVWRIVMTQKNRPSSPATPRRRFCRSSGLRQMTPYPERPYRQSARVRRS